MKSNKIFASLLIAVSSLIASCSKENSQPTPSKESLSIERLRFSTDFSQSATSEDEFRTTLADDGHKVNWTEGTDKISVFSDNEPTKNRAFTAVDVNQSEAIFEGIASVATKYSAIYPYISTNRFNGVTSTFTTTLKTEQSAVLGTYTDNTSISVATLDNFNPVSNKRFKFRNATGLLKIEFSLAPALADKKITRIELRGNPDSEGIRPNISGTAVVTAGTSSIHPTTKITTDGKPYIALVDNDGATIAPTSDDKGYYIVVPTEAIGQVFWLTFIASDGTGITKKINANTPFSSNKIKKVRINIDQLETHILNNIPLIKAIEKQGIRLISEADGTVNYFKNIDEIERARTINGQNTETPITSLDELEYYRNLKEIRLQSVPTLSGAINIDKNPHMYNVSISGTGITSFNIENADKLETVRLNNNTSLSSVKIASTSVATVNLGQNWNISSLDVTQASALTNLSARNNKITSLDLSQNTALRSLDLLDNRLQSLDVSHNTALTTLTASNNQIREIDLSQNTALTSINLHVNQLQSIDVSRNTELTHLDVSNNQLVGIDISSNAKITNLNLHGNGTLTDIVFPQNSKLKILTASSTGIETLDLSKTKDLETINVNNASQLTTIIGLTELSKLNTFFGYITKLESLDFSGNPLLKALDLYRSRLSSLDITRNPQILKETNNSFFVGSQPGTITVTMTAAQKALFDRSFASSNKNLNVNIVVQ